MIHDLAVECKRLTKLLPLWTGLLAKHLVFLPRIPSAIKQVGAATATRDETQSVGIDLLNVPTDTIAEAAMDGATNNSEQMREVARLPLRITTVGRLGRYMSPRASGLLVPAGLHIERGDRVTVDLELGKPHPRRLELAGEVDLVGVYASGLSAPGNQVVRVRLDRDSWKALFVCVCRTPWRRRHDFQEEPGERRRWRLSEPGLCFVPSTGKRYDATLIEVSDQGAFIGLDTAHVSPGEVVRFRGRHDMGWHSGEVRWHGVKASCSGVGVRLSFDAPEDRSRWISYLGVAQRRR